MTAVAVEVALLHWPREQARRERLASTMQPRLLLVAAGEDPPSLRGDELEDWIRLPADERDVSTRLRVLSERAAASLRATAVVDGCLLRRGGAQVDLTPSEAALAERLVGTPGQVVSRIVLIQAIWPDAPPSGRALDDLAYRLRRRVRPLGLDLLASRRRGFMLTPLSPVEGGPFE